MAVALVLAEEGDAETLHAYIYYQFFSRMYESGHYYSFW
jgi:hypothetical protein